jgi:SAM-dependent methyltransferase
VAGAEELTALGEEWYRRGDLQRSLAAFLEAASVLPSHARAHANAAIVYWRLGKSPQALLHCEQAATLASSDPSVVVQCAEVFRESARQDKAAAICEHYLARHGHEPAVAAILQSLRGVAVGAAAATESRAVSGGGQTFVEQEIADAATLINYCIERFAYSKYLEIGCRDDDTFRQIRAPYKVGVDPVSGGTHRLTSDEFFRLSNDSFDIVFVDGLHYCEQVYADVRNALCCLRPNGIIVLHDCHPSQEVHQLREAKTYVWNGDVWKAFVLFRQDLGLEAIVADFDHGVGLIRPGKNNLPLELQRPYQELTWAELSENKATWLRLADAAEVKRWLQRTKN